MNTHEWEKQSENLRNHTVRVKDVLLTFFRAYSLLSVFLLTLNTSEKAPLPKSSYH
jgi:hypothetical protein